MIINPLTLAKFTTTTSIASYRAVGGVLNSGSSSSNIISSSNSKTTAALLSLSRHFGSGSGNGDEASDDTTNGNNGVNGNNNNNDNNNVNNNNSSDNKRKVGLEGSSQQRPGGPGGPGGRLGGGAPLRPQSQAQAQAQRPGSGPGLGRPTTSRSVRPAASRPMRPPPSLEQQQQRSAVAAAARARQPKSSSTNNSSTTPSSSIPSSFSPKKLYPKQQKVALSKPLKIHKKSKGNQPTQNNEYPFLPNNNNNNSNSNNNNNASQPSKYSQRQNRRPIAYSGGNSNSGSGGENSGGSTSTGGRITRRTSKSFDRDVMDAMANSPEMVHGLAEVRPSTIIGSDRSRRPNNNNNSAGSTKSNKPSSLLATRRNLREQQVQQTKNEKNTLIQQFQRIRNEDVNDICRPLERYDEDGTMSVPISSMGNNRGGSGMSVSSLNSNGEIYNGRRGTNPNNNTNLNSNSNTNRPKKATSPKQIQQQLWPFNVLNHYQKTGVMLPHEIAKSMDQGAAAAVIAATSSSENSSNGEDDINYGNLAFYKMNESEEHYMKRVFNMDESKGGGGRNNRNRNNNRGGGRNSKEEEDGDNYGGGTASLYEFLHDDSLREPKAMKIVNVKHPPGNFVNDQYDSFLFVDNLPHPLFEVEDDDDVAMDVTTMDNDDDANTNDTRTTTTEKKKMIHGDYINPLHRNTVAQTVADLLGGSGTGLSSIKTTATTTTPDDSSTTIPATTNTNVLGNVDISNDIHVSSMTSAFIRFRTPELATDAYLRGRGRRRIILPGEKNTPTVITTVHFQPANRQIITRRHGSTGDIVIDAHPYRNVSDGVLVVKGDTPSVNLYRSHRAVLHLSGDGLLHLCNGGGDDSSSASHGNSSNNTNDIIQTKRELAKQLQKYCHQPIDIYGSIEIVLDMNGENVGRCYVGFDEVHEMEDVMNDLGRCFGVETNYGGGNGGNGEGGCHFIPMNGENKDGDINNNKPSLIHIRPVQQMKLANKDNTNNNNNNNNNSYTRGPIPTGTQLYDSLHHGWEEHVSNDDLSMLEDAGIDKSVLEEAFAATRHGNNATFGIDGDLVGSNNQILGDRSGYNGGKGSRGLPILNGKERPPSAGGIRFKEFVQMYVETLREVCATKDKPGDMYEALFVEGEEIDLSLFDHEEERLDLMKDRYNR